MSWPRDIAESGPPGSGLASLNICEPVVFDAEGGTALLLLAADTASVTPGGSNLDGLHTVSVTFPAGWDGLDVEVSGPGRTSATVNEVFVYSGPGEQKVEGEVVFSDISQAVCSGTGSGDKIALIGVGIKFCLANAPVTAVVGVWSFGASYTSSLMALDAAAGTFEVSGISPTQGTYMVLYRIEAS